MENTMAVFDQLQVVWIVIVGFPLTFLLAFSIGANSVPNAFATSIGAKVLTHFQAVILAAIFITLGAVIIGPVVANTIENNIVDITLYESNPGLLMLGQVSVILACAIWKIIATCLKLPVAATHSAVGAVVGFHIVAIGTNGIQWKTLIFIAMSWVTSPLFSGILSVVFYLIVFITIVEKENPLDSGAKTLPVWFGFVVFINVLSVHLQLGSLFEELFIPWYVSVANSLVCAILTAALVWFCFVPSLKKAKEAENATLLKNAKMTPFSGMDKVAFDQYYGEAIELKDFAKDSGSVSSLPKSNQSELIEVDVVHENSDVAKLCSPLLLVSVMFSACTYGSILVSIAVAPLITIWDVYETQNVTTAIENPFWMFIFGSIAMIFGFAFVGGRVTETIGEGITPLSSSSAFPIELSATLVLSLASNLGVPVSTAHCKIGAIAAAGCVTDGGVDFKLLWKIVLAWVVTLPATIGLSAGFMMLFQLTFQYPVEELVLIANSTLQQINF